MTTTNTQTTKHPAENAVKLIGETLVPGASLLLDGNIVGGGVHLLLGTLARAAFGPIGVALVIANSYSQSSTGKGLLKQLSNDDKSESKTSHKAAS
jgi:hypothetical protein